MDDTNILELFWARSQEAVSAAAECYGALCRAVAGNILANPQDAEECVNDVWLAAWNAIPPARPERMGAFLARMTRNIALDKLDYNKALKRNGELDLALSELEECLGSRSGVEERVEAGQTADAIDAFLRTLPREQRWVFLRRYWYADPIAEIAHRGGMSQGKVKSMLFRTREKLKVYLEQEGIAV